jgi:ABC-type transport system involved in cytochrome bd biosynthesis fused ATPase/permease subunit
MFEKLVTVMKFTLLITLFTISKVIIFVTIKKPFCGILLTGIISLLIVFVSMIFEEKMTLDEQDVKKKRQKFWEKSWFSITISTVVSPAIAGI